MDERRAYSIAAGLMIRQLRAVQDMTQKTLAERAFVSKSALSRFELGDSLPDAYQVVMIARAFDLSPHALLSLFDDALARSHAAAAKFSSSPVTEREFAGLAAAAISTMLEGC